MTKSFMKFEVKTGSWMYGVSFFFASWYAISSASGESWTCFPLTVTESPSAS